MVKIRTNNTEAIINQLADKTYGTSINSETEDRVERITISAMSGSMYDAIDDIVLVRRKSKQPNSNKSAFIGEILEAYIAKLGKK